MAKIGGRAKVIGALAVKSLLGFGLLVALGAADAPGPTSWFSTGVWVGAGIVFLFVLAFLLSRVIPKGNDDNPDSPL